MGKLLKYEFRGMRSYFYIFASVIILAYTVQIISGNKGILFGGLVTFPVLMGFFTVIVTGFYNEVAKEQDQLIYQTPSSIYKILGAKLINAFIMVLLISLLINIFNILTGYVPFMSTSGTLRTDRLPDSHKNIIRLFNVFWNSTIIVALIALCNFVASIKAAFFKNRWFGTAAMLVLGIALFYGFIWLEGVVMQLLPMNLVMNNGVNMHFKNILNSGDFVTGSSSAFSINISNNLVSTFYEDDYKVVLGLASIIVNALVIAVLYPITAWIIKKKVFI